MIIVSDSHGNISKIDDILRKYENKFDYFIHLGDRIYDMISFTDVIPRLIAIRGNIELHNPMHSDLGQNEVSMDIEGMKLFITHGSRYSVESTLVFLKKHAAKLGAQIVLFGHTHMKFLEFQDGILFFNPGALVDNDYGILEIEDGEITSIEHSYLSERW